jgi:membrane protease YdiL (CAAX protease family)
VCDDLVVASVLNRRVLRNEILLLLGVSLGADAIYAVLDLISALTRPVPLSQQTVQINPAVTPDRPWLDLAFQLYRLIPLVVPALLAIHLLNREDGQALNRLGINGRHKIVDPLAGIGLALLIGIPGIGLYYLGRKLGIGVNVAAATLEHVWWAVPVLVLLAAANGWLEEVIVVGYLVTRLRDLGWSTWQIILTSALLRGSYHLYQGFGAFVGNAIMGVIFAGFFLAFKRVLPLVIAHTLLDVGAFVGYTLLHGHVSGI